MKSGEQRERDKSEDMYDELYEWRQQHPEASFDEIANQVTPRRQDWPSLEPLLNSPKFLEAPAPREEICLTKPCRCVIV